MRGVQPSQALVLFLFWNGFVLTAGGNTEPDRPYYIRRSPVILVSQPLDGNLGCEDFVSLTCEVMGMEPIISGWWPNIYWRHNGSIVNSTWPGNVTIDTNYWNMTTLHSSFPGTYQCIVDDGSFILASRLATVKEGECVTPQQKSNFHMVCGGQGAPAYSWYKDGIPLNSSTYLVEEEGRIVTVTNETRDPFGLYTCIASGVIRQWYLPPQASKSTDIKENNTVLIDGSPNDVVVSHSGYGMTMQDIALNCNITVPGNAVNITWFHNGEQNHSLSADTVHFPRNSNVSAIAGTYVCAASTSNWEARVQFRILLKYKPNPPSSIHSHCNAKYPEINGQELRLSWSLNWHELEPVDGCENCEQRLVISRQKHSNEKCFLPMTAYVTTLNRTLQLDSDYCISLIATTKKDRFERYFLSQGNSTLHHCTGKIQSCQQMSYQEHDFKTTPCNLLSDETLSIKCEDPQSGKVKCAFRWQQPAGQLLKPAYKSEVTPEFNVTCPAEFSTKNSMMMSNNLVATSQVSFPAVLFDCPLMCQANMCLRKVNSKDSDCLYMRSGNFTSRSAQLTEPTITCSTLKGESSLHIEIPQDAKHRILNCSRLDPNNTNSGIRVNVFVNERAFDYSAQLNDTLEIPMTDFSNESDANRNVTVVAMYSNRAGICSCVTGWNGSQCNEAVCTPPCLNGGYCFKPDMCMCVGGWSGSACMVPPQTPHTFEFIAYVLVAVGLSLMCFPFLIICLCCIYNRSRNPMTEDLTMKWESDLHKEYYLESVAECDAPTVFESVDCEILSQVSSSKSFTSEVMKSSDYIQCYTDIRAEEDKGN